MQPSHTLFPFMTINNKTKCITRIEIAYQKKKFRILFFCCTLISCENKQEEDGYAINFIVVKTALLLMASPFINVFQISNTFFPFPLY